MDPYTDNEILRAKLDHLAKPAAGASLGTRLVIPPIPNMVGAVDDVAKVVWQKDRLDLLLRNKDLLDSMDMRTGVVEQFIGNESFSPTQQTAIVSAIASMKGVRNRGRLLEYAGSAATEAEAAFYTNLVALLSLYNDKRMKLSAVEYGGPAGPLGGAPGVVGHRQSFQGGRRRALGPWLDTVQPRPPTVVLAGNGRRTTVPRSFGVPAVGWLAGGRLASTGVRALSCPRSTLFIGRLCRCRLNWIC